MTVQKNELKDSEGRMDDCGSDPGIDRSHGGSDLSEVSYTWRVLSRGIRIT